MLLRTLSGRLLLLTMLFVMLAEVLILVPSAANFRRDYLHERLARAQIAAFALLATQDEMVSPDLEAELLANAEVLNVALQREKRRELVLSGPMPGPVDASFDLREAGFFSLIYDLMVCITAPPGRIVRVVGMPVKAGGEVIEVVLPEDPLRAEIILYVERILGLSLLISLSTAILLFLSVRRFVTRPISRVVESMMRFRDDPEDPSRVILPSARDRELAEAERALHELQSRLISALKQKERLAQLGGAVARIAHDLRNVLTTAQLLADRIDASRDPTVKRVAPKLLSSLDRAIQLCERTLEYGRSEEPSPERRRVKLRTLVADIGENELLAVQGPAITYENAVPEEMMVDADPDQLFRVLGNLIRNARQALEAENAGGTIQVSAAETAAGAEILVRDSGPGLPTRALENLFQPFRGGSRRGGSGLGLAIAAELVRGHGGTLELVETSTEGTTFRILLPPAAAAAEPGSAEPTSRLHPGDLVAR
ncbi:MAG TPA: HAMP domain-containing sensor histidine kinase [Paracoccaceae bacterium]|nr:HAMP domain-containing sensor histidine kinase [Paracoccaceae bacterium]